MTNQPRHSENNRRYEGEGIAVLWEPGLCIHTANCIRNLPEVFVPTNRPWVDVTKANAEAIAEAVRSCPTGALRYERTDGAPQEEAPGEVTVVPQRDGPLFVRGSFQVIDAEGNVVRSVTRAALCRCGFSENKPFCDNS